MTGYDIQELIQRARAVVKPRRLSDLAEAGGVGSALITTSGNIYVGTCIEAECGMGTCAEHTAVAAMLTAGEDKIVAIVAVAWDNTIYSPCGRCREFLFQINGNNGDIDIILGEDKAVKLSALLPEHWYKYKNANIEGKNN